MAWSITSIQVIAFLIVYLSVSSLCNAVSTEELKKEEDLPDNIHKTIDQSSNDRPLDLSTHERSGPIELNKKAIEIKETIGKPIVEDRSNSVPLYGRNGPIELTGQSHPIQIIQRKGPVSHVPIELTQKRRPTIIDGNDYRILDRLRLPFRSFDDIPLRSFYDAGINNTPFGAYRDNNFDRTYRSDRGSNTEGSSFRLFSGRDNQRVPFISEQSYGNNRQFIPQHVRLVQGSPFPSRPNPNVPQRPVPSQYSAAPDRSFLSRQIPIAAGEPFMVLPDNVEQKPLQLSHGQTVEQSPIPSHYNFAPGKPFSSDQSSVETEKQFTGTHDDIALNRQFQSQQSLTKEKKPIPAQYNDAPDQQFSSHHTSIETKKQPVPFHSNISLDKPFQPLSNDQTVMQRPIPSQYGVVPDRPLLSRHIPIEAEKEPMTYENIAPGKPLQPYHSQTIIQRPFPLQYDIPPITSTMSHHTTVPAGKQFMGSRGNVALDKPFTLHHGQTNIHRPSLPQYNIVPAKPILSRHTVFPARKPFTEPHGTVLLHKPLTSHHDIVVLDKAFSSPQSTISLTTPPVGGTFAVEKPVMLQQESIAIGKSLSPQKEGITNNNAKLDKSVDDINNFFPLLRRNNLRQRNCGPNKAWRLFINPKI